MQARVRRCIAAAAAATIALALPGTAATAQAAEVLSARALPGALPDSGGKVEVVSQVRGAKSCRLAVLGDHGVKVSLPEQASCSDGSYREPVVLGPNHSKSPVTVKLGLFADRSRGVFYVVVAGAPTPARPAVLEAKATPWQLPATGGWTKVVGKVRDAKSCHLVALGWQHPVLPAQGCAAGSFSEKLWLSPNAQHVAKSQAFELVAVGNGSAIGKFFVRLAPAPEAPPTTVTPTTKPATPTPTTIPASTPPLASPGGGGGFVLPPPSPGPTTTTTVPQTTTTTTVPQTTTTTTPTLTSTATEQSANWSGYVIQPQSGGQFTSETGTFTVPTISLPSSCNDVVSIWDGVDGFSNSYLLQAGVDVSTEDFANGTCDTSKVSVGPWVEAITPGNVPPAAGILTWNAGTLAGQPADVAPGDKVNVTIAETASGSGTWSITLKDLTTGGEWTTTVNWAGPGQSAEWVVEDIDQPDNSACTYQPAGSSLHLCPLPDFSKVDFSGLGASPGGSTGAWTGTYIDSSMGQSTPSTLEPNGTFYVTYAQPSTTITFAVPFAKTLGTPVRRR